FKGTPRKTDCDTAVDQNWTGSPTSGLPKDNFTVRWTVTRDFGSGGPFALTTTGLDGIRVYLDGTRRIDLWKNVSSTVTKTANITIPSGKHTLRLDYANWTGTAKVKFTYTPRTSATVDKVKPLAPRNPLVSYDTTSGKAKLSWGANVEMDLAGYRVYRRLKGSTTWTRLAAPTATSYTDTPPATGAVYYYEVRAHDKAGNESAGTADQQVTSIVLGSPGSLAASVTDTGAELSWQTVPGAVKYRVLRTDPGGGEKTTDVTGSGFADGSLDRISTYTYRVAAVDGSGHLSPYTDPVSAHRPPAAPRGLTATADVGAALLAWTVKPGDADVSTFRVYRSTTLPVDTSGAPVPCTTTRTELADGSQRYSCGDYSAEEATTYHYVVTTVDRSGAVSLPSQPVTVATLASDKPPAPVTGLTATPTEYGFELRWDPDPAPDLFRYLLYTGEVVRDGDDALCQAHEEVWLTPDVTSYRYQTLPDGAERCFLVDPYDSSWNSPYEWSGAGEIVSATELDLTPSVPTSGDSPVKLTAIPNGDRVDLSWNEVPDAVGYQVYRWNPDTGAYEQLAATTTATSYHDTGAAKGTTHFYRVTARYADGTESAPGADHAIMAP
ncbi:PA14 domain-containing protein, partial [Streptomyces sp. NPDC005648]|uniref:PA14 domain-containing protein n=1 Tax=Streptomyces sp. NPDC005648 TaxID=3157044 RepID=UPI00339F069C